MEPTVHRPVLLEEVLEGLGVRSGGRYIDCTLGGAGHSAAILERSRPDGRLLGLDADPQAIARARQRLAPFAGRFALVQANFRDLPRVAADFAPADGILFDFGLSSDQLEVSGRGFSFQRDEPLDMRFDPTGSRTAADLVNSLSEEELADVIYEFGEESRSRRIARSIVAARPIEMTGQLVEAIERAVGPGGRRHSATQVFQALRIVVNEEIETIRFVLPHAVDLLARGGRLVTISFHSLEDRVVKEFLRREAVGWRRADRWEGEGRHAWRHQTAQPGPPPAGRLKLVTRKVVMASDTERRDNPRSRSARLRVAERR
ncbi:MAG TPA: 16S rRNA (cytosine(1402)-N(4))-methyltransferase RsmH [Dehalococcoidia bacterium]|nr:16S rRNA (cytosine(1402)-N(4))-methyltransferase RsmH [Dehalococcoidia bacterium]